MIGSVVPLSKDNYHQWIIEVNDILAAHGLSTIVDGTRKRPEDGDKDQRTWDADDAKARIVMRRTIGQVAFNNVRDCRTSKEIFDRIKSLWEAKTFDVLMTGIHDFLDETWKDGDDVTSFIARLSMIGARVDGIGDAKLRIDDRWMIMKIMLSLPKPFEIFVNSWTLQPEVEKKTLDELREALINAERNQESGSKENGVSGEEYSDDELDLDHEDQNEIDQTGSGGVFERDQMDGGQSATSDGSWNDPLVHETQHNLTQQAATSRDSRTRLDLVLTAIALADGDGLVGVQDGSRLHGYRRIWKHDIPDVITMDQCQRS